MKILYDATPLLLRSAGVKNYHYALLTRLKPLLEAGQLRLFPFLNSWGTQRNEQSNFGPAATAWRLGAVLASNYLRLPVPRWAAGRYDLFHITSHLMHPPDGVRLTSLVHDPTPLLMPQFHTPGNVRYFRDFAREVLPRLTGVAVPSEAVRRDLVEHLRIGADRITVIPHGVSAEFFTAATAPPAGLPGRYLLSVGTLEPRKNLTALLDAYALLPQDLRREYPLVVAGASGWKNETLRRRLEQDKARGVKTLGYVSPEQLPGLYAGAAAFVFPSLYEGFGMPLLEAMAAGTPVIASNASAMPEVVGEAGLLVDPRSPEEISRAILHVLGNPDFAARLGETGRQRARQFTWERTALATRAFFERAGG